MIDPMDVEVPELKNLLERDDYLRPYEREFRRRYGCFQDYLKRIAAGDGSLDQFTKSYQKFGIHIEHDGSVYCLEWAPGAKAVYLAGDFNNWNTESHPYRRLEFGKWELTIPPAENGGNVLKHLSEVKIVVENQHGHKEYRLSPWATYVVAPEISGHAYKQKIWHPSDAERYVFKFDRSSFKQKI